MVVGAAVVVVAAAVVVVGAAVVVVGAAVVVVGAAVVVVVVVGGSEVGATDDPPEQALATSATRISTDHRMSRR